MMTPKEVDAELVKLADRFGKSIEEVRRDYEAIEIVEIKVHDDGGSLTWIHDDGWSLTWTE